MHKSMLCALLCLLGSFAPSLAYFDPAKKTHAHATGGCPTNGSNHAEYPFDSVLPPLTAHPFNVSHWVQQYVSALAAQPTDYATLRKLKRASAEHSFNLPKSFDQRWFDFIQIKLKMLDSLELRMNVSKLWRPGRNLIDVGGGHGMLGAYLMAKYGMQVKVFEAASSYQCEEILSSPLKVNFFDGHSLPVANNAADAVSFMSVLHHAGNATERLLSEAARVARKWILVLEDTQTPEVSQRNRQHDPGGIFRTDDNWKQLFQRVPGFSLVRAGYVGAPVARHGFVSTVRGDEKRCFQKWYVLEARSQRTVEQSLDAVCSWRAPNLMTGGGGRLGALRRFGGMRGGGDDR